MASWTNLDVTTGKGAAGSRYRLVASPRSLLASGMQPSAPPPETPDAKHSFEQLRIEAA